MFKRLAKQLKTERVENSCFPMSSPVNSLKEQTKNTFLNILIVLRKWKSFLLFDLKNFLQNTNFSTAT